MIEKMVGVIAMVVGVPLHHRRNERWVPVGLIQTAQRLGQLGQRQYAPVSRVMGAI